MPMYQVWYRDSEAPLAFTTASRCSEDEIVQRILAHEHIAAPAGEEHASASAMIAANKLAPVRYLEDESEINRIE